MTIHNAVLVIASIVGLALAIVLAASLRRYTKKAGYDGAGYKKHIRGTQIVPIKKLRKQCTQPGVKQIDVAGVPMPTDIETLNLLICGTSGSGKSVLLCRLTARVQQRNDRMVIVDPGGDLYSKFGRPGDVLLNPYDQRTEGWSIFNEARSDDDWTRLAMSVVPLGKDANAEEWNSFGRLILRETARKLQARGTSSIEALYHWCVSVPHEELQTFLAGTQAESLFAGSSEASKALTSARFVLSNKLSEHMSMPRGKFSIRDWMERGSGCLFITWREDMKHAMKPLLSAWVDVFCTALLSLPEDQQRRWWAIIDELASLEKLASLEDLLTKGRKNGVRVVAGLCSVSQLRDIYGKQTSQTVLASFRSQVVLNGSDPETAEEMSKALGEHEVVQVDATNGSETLTRAIVPAVTANEIRALPLLPGYVAFAGDRPISKFSLEPINFPTRNAPFEQARLSGDHDGPPGDPEGSSR